MAMQHMRIAVLLMLAIAAVAAIPAVAVGKNPASVLNGVYRVRWTEKEAIAAGAPYRSAHADFGFAHGTPVVITITLRKGRFSLRDTSARPLCTGSYTSSANAVSINLTAHCHGRIGARWSLQGRLLRLRVNEATDPGDKVVFGAKLWRQIG
jgi:hypothetical protein